MDIQQLPAIKGGSGFEYKISVIHMRTRIKYSEIHDDYRSETVADVLLSALDHLPPFRLIWTDNAMTFTMRFTAHPDRTTAFQDLVRSPDMIHGMCKPRSPWQNGIIERSHRTDNEELFHILKFHDSEERRYQLRLFEMYYAYERPHQGLSGHTPSEVYLRDYPMHAAARMINAPRPITYGFQGTS
jgi:transposase InsO family protein